MAEYLCLYRGFHRVTGVDTGTSNIVWSTCCADCGQPGLTPVTP